METRAHHVLIGLFTLLSAGAALLFALWLGKSSLDSSYDNYVIVFHEAVTGLSSGSPVQFNGIKVGEVVRLRLDAADPSKVLATIRVAASTPVRSNTRARLSLAGVTGTAFIQLSSGAGASLPLTAAKGQLPQISATPSSISRLLNDGSDLLGKISELLDNANRLFSAENSANFGKTLSNLEQTTSALAAQREDLHKAFGDFARVSEQASKALEQATTLLASSNRLLEEQGSSSLSDLQQTMAALQRSSASVENLLSQNQGALNQGLQSLGSLQPALDELRQTLANLRGISQRLEENPAGYLLGRDQAKEFQP
ncbi:MlaD family protein [Pseudomonas sp. N040]|uniref:MlaD family protein n=1 Tax=Pseudomonas sp. N040 TaxID=2785325 RepID=UPI0018A2CB53|nr:MlaD family protein [Pseudomonas sp. N040]MBF7728806.1 MCE family protein [Pseudomonas sp. N040]MBW7012446.1 MCE family protein [Pseudomonas sp. N040]